MCMQRMEVRWSKMRVTHPQLRGERDGGGGDGQLQRAGATHGERV